MSRRLGIALSSGLLLVSLASCQVVSGLGGVDLDGGSGGGTGGVCVDKPITINDHCGPTFLDSDVVNPNSQCITKTGASCKRACDGSSAMLVACAATATEICKPAMGGTCGTCLQSCACPEAHANCFAACDVSCKSACRGDSNCEKVCPGACAAGCDQMPNSCASACAAACGPSANSKCAGEVAACLKAGDQRTGCHDDCGGNGALFCDGVWMSPRDQSACLADLRALGVQVTTN